jgi:ATP-dependent RNA helicase RhlE
MNTDFGAMALHPKLLASIEALGFTKPTPVQAEAIPAGLAGRDVLACAATGSGKTAAFALPILEHLLEQKRGKTRALVLVPTRELAAQVEEHTRALARGTGITVASVFGGVGMGPQEDAFRKGVDVIVATPGRLLDHFSRDYAKLDALEVLVLDEADRMLDMGFLPDIRKVLAHLPKTKRQTFFFSATMPPAIAKLSKELLRDAAQIAVERKQAPAAGVMQALYPVAQTVKIKLLMELLRRGEINEAIVFCRTKHRANRVAEKLEKADFNVARIHGNRSQKQRTEALEGFKSGRFRVLVATDILARGIDVEALEHVVNFDVPATPEDYIHRVGRTGRADLKGDAYTFASPEESALVRDIEKKLGKPIPKRTLADFDYKAASDEPLEIPIGERIAKIRAERQAARQRTAEKEARRNGGGTPARSASGNGRSARSSQPAKPRNEAPRTPRPAEVDDEDRIPPHVDNRDPRSRKADQPQGKRPAGAGARRGGRGGSGGATGGRSGGTGGGRSGGTGGGRSGGTGGGRSGGTGGGRSGGTGRRGPGGGRGGSGRGGRGGS